MTKRIHSSLGYLTPAEFEAALAGDRHDGLDTAIGRGYGAPVMDKEPLASGGK